MLRAADMVSPAPGCRVGPYPAQIVAFGARAGGGGGWQARAARRGTDSTTCGGEKMKKSVYCGAVFPWDFVVCCYLHWFAIALSPIPFFFSLILSVSHSLSHSLTHTHK